MLSSWFKRSSLGPKVEKTSVSGFLNWLLVASVGSNTMSSIIFDNVCSTLVFLFSNSGVVTRALSSVVKASPVPLNLMSVSGCSEFWVIFSLSILLTSASMLPFKSGVPLKYCLITFAFTSGWFAADVLTLETDNSFWYSRKCVFKYWTVASGRLSIRILSLADISTTPSTSARYLIWAGV